MPYRFQAGEEVEDAVIRIAREQIGRAIDEIDDADLTPHDAVHQVRKRCKKLRGLLRIVRPALGSTYPTENGCFRDAARSLSDLRDARTLVACADDLLQHFRHEVQPSLAHGLHDRLVARCREASSDGAGIEDRLGAVRASLQEAYGRAGSWRLEGSGVTVIAAGLKKTYGRGRDAMEAAYAQPSAAAFHDWRKRAKYHWYHQRLLRPLWKALVKPAAEALEALGGLLGDEHDLAVLGTTLLEVPDRFADPRDLEVILALVDRRRLELQQLARPLGQRIFAESPGALIERLTTYWRAWEHEQDVVPGVSPMEAQPQGSRSI